MNKLVLNIRKFNYTRFMLTKEGLFDNIPTDEKEKYDWCAKRFDELQHRDDVKRLCCYSHKKKGYMITVWEMDGLYYLILCVRTISGDNYKNTIYVDTEREQMLGIAKFLDKNNQALRDEYRNQILEARDALVKEQLKVVGEAEDADGAA